MKYKGMLRGSYFIMLYQKFSHWMITIITIIAFADFSSVNVNSYKLIKAPYGHLSPSRVSDSLSSDWSDELFQSSTLPAVSSSVIGFLDKSLGSLMTTCAINTVGYYMLEFHDDLSNDWMTSFLDYKKNGFENDDWQNFLQQMIIMDKQNIDVTLQSKKQVTAVNPRNGKKKLLSQDVSLHYIHDLEPRKIAHKIVTVREHVSNEMIEDLTSIKLENQEAIKYARLYLTSANGNSKSNKKENADVHRGITRMSELEGSTPLRNRNFLDCSVLITNVALDIVRADLKQKHDDISLQHLDEVIQKVSGKEPEIETLETLISKLLGPRALLEELCILGLKDGMSFKKPTSNSGSSGGDATNANILKLAQNVMDTRWALALETSKILHAQNNLSRNYYKMIRDYGGFTLFDKSKRPEIVVVKSPTTTTDSNTGDEQQASSSTSNSRQPSKLMEEEKLKAQQQTEKSIEVSNAMPATAASPKVVDSSDTNTGGSVEEDTTDLDSLHNPDSFGPIMM